MAAVKRDEGIIKSISNRIIIYNLNLFRTELKQIEKSPTYQAKLAEERALELIELDNIEQLNKIEHEKWIESELKVEREWAIQKCKLEEQAKKKEAERKRIQEEFEAEQKRIAVVEEEKKRLIEEEKQRQIDLERRIRAYIDGVGEVPPELLIDAETNPAKEMCQFFLKTAACRFGNKCLRNHKRPRLSKVLLMPAFFTNIHLDQSEATEYGNDLTLEYDENELITSFHRFFEDVVPEFENFGCIKHFVSCTNYEPHLRGHVLVEFTSQR